MKNKSVVLLSSGLDSTVNLYAALLETEVVKTITFNYGQKSASKEIECAKKISDRLKLSHVVIDLPWLKQLGGSALTDDQKNIPTGSQIAIDSLEVSKKTAQSVWVPNRNGVFLNIAASFAESLGAKIIIPGFNAEEAVTFPDNSFDFMRALRKSFSYSTANQVDVVCYTVAKSKIEIVKMGMGLGVPFDLIWPCYKSGEKWCGQCESCIRARRALHKNNVDFLGRFE